jgi:POT family proton-dependent oligopeptide transporter
MADSTTQQPQGQFFGHPRGLATLFFTEFWERFSYYGMRAILLLFMTAPAASAGLGMDANTAGLIYGLYTSMAYLATVGGGWVADRLIGQQNAVFYGGILISAGNGLIAISSSLFFPGLVLIALGTGLLKGNVSAMVGGLYGKDEPAKRDAGFSIFYMGINAGAFVAPFIVGYLGEKVNWHLGFAASSIGMVIGLFWYKLTSTNIAHVGVVDMADSPERRHAMKTLMIATTVIVGSIGSIFLLSLLGIFSPTTTQIKTAVSIIFVLLPAAFFASVFRGGDLDRAEKKRFAVIGLFFLMSAIFWGGFEQAGTTFTLFARDMTNRMVAGWEVPTSYFQSLNAMFILLLAPIFATIWVKLGDTQPSSPAKLSWGLIIAGAGFALIGFAAVSASADNKISPLWLLAVYCIHTVGELFLSPVGLSNVTKLSPPKYVSQAMGIWFLGASLGNFLAGQAAGFIEHYSPSTVFFIVFAIMAGSGTLVLLFTSKIKTMMGGVK